MQEVCSSKRHGATKHGIENDAKRPHVSRSCVVVGGQLAKVLERAVVCRVEDDGVAGRGVVHGCRAGKAKARELDGVACWEEEEVVQLDVSVGNVFAVQKGCGGESLLEEALCKVGVQATFALHLGQEGERGVLCEEEDMVLGFVEPDCVDNVGVLEREEGVDACK